MNTKKIDKNGSWIVVGLSIANFLVKILGLLREVLLAQIYGTSIYTDAYIIANNIPAVLFASFGTSIATTFIPMYSKIKEEKNEKRANTFALHMIEIVFIVCVLITLIGEIFVKQVVFVFASGFQGDVLNLTIVFSKILFPSIFGLALMNVLGAYLQQHEKFVPIALVPLVSNGTIICTLILSYVLNNIHVLVWGTLLGYIAQIIFYIPWVVKIGILNRENILLIRDKYIFLLMKIVLPVFIGEAVNEINSIVDRTLVSGLETGSVSALNYAYKIINLIMGVIVASIGTIVFPKFSKYAAEKNNKELQKLGSDIVTNIFKIMLPIMISTIIFRKEIVQLLFQRGSFNNDSTILTATALGCYSIGLIGMGMRDIITKLFYSVQDTREPMINGIICAMLNIILDILFIHIWGLYGAALATALVAIIGCIRLMIVAQKKQLINTSKTKQPILKTIIIGIVLFVFDISLKCFIDYKCGNQFYMHILLSGIVGLVGVAIYFGIQYLVDNHNYI